MAVRLAGFFTSSARRRLAPGDLWVAARAAGYRGIQRSSGISDPEVGRPLLGGRPQPGGSGLRGQRCRLYLGPAGCRLLIVAESPGAIRPGDAGFALVARCLVVPALPP